MTRSEILERKAKQIGFWYFNRWARNQGMSIDQTLAVVRNVFHKVP